MDRIVIAFADESIVFWNFFESSSVLKIQRSTNEFILEQLSLLRQEEIRLTGELTTLCDKLGISAPVESEIEGKLEDFVRKIADKVNEDVLIIEPVEHDRFEQLAARSALDN